MKLDGIDLGQFNGNISVKNLFNCRCRCVPTEAGVYVLVRNSSNIPEFLQESKAGRFKGLDPSYPLQDVKDKWVKLARIVYIGKAAGARGLRQRIRQLVDFGYGKPVGHRGGRLLWHLRDHMSLNVLWFECARSGAAALETDLINQFKGEYDHRRPFANHVN